MSSNKTFSSKKSNKNNVLRGLETQTSPAPYVQHLSRAPPVVVEVVGAIGRTVVVIMVVVVETLKLKSINKVT